MRRDGHRDSMTVAGSSTMTIPRTIIEMVITITERPPTSTCQWFLHGRQRVQAAGRLA